MLKRRALILLLILMVAIALHPFIGTLILYGVAVRLENLESLFIESSMLKNHVVSSNGSNSAIPHRIHQTFRSKHGIPQHWQRAQNSCKILNPNYEFRLWTDEDIDTFIKVNYSWFYPTFQNYPYPIQRVDAARYFILYHYGGVYMDLDIGCRRSLDPLLMTNQTAILPKTYPVGVSNDFMAATPKHPFFELLTKQLQYFDHWYVLPYLTIFFSTGPAFLTSRLYWGAKRDVAILPPTFYSNHSSPDMFFFHECGNSWHDWDVGFYKWAYEYGTLILVGCVVCFGFGIVTRNLRASHKSKLAKD